jgi:predicted MFS family arabinose efflux permease
VGGLLTDRLGWRSVFVATPPVAVLVLAWLLRRVRGEWADARGERFDWLGSAVYALSLVALIGGLSRFPGPAGAALLGGAALGLAAFGAIESRHPHPVFDVQTLLRNRAFAFSNLAALLHYSATFAVGYLLSLYLQVVRGWGAQAAGTLLLVQPAVMAALSPAAGRASDRVPPRLVASAGMALTALGLGLLAASVGPATHTATLAAYLALLGLGFALFSSPNTNAVMSAVEPRAYGVASAAVGTARLTGQMLSLGLATTVLAASLGRAPLEPALHPAFLRAMRLAFALFAGLCAAGVFASLARDPAPARDPRARAARRP